MTADEASVLYIKLIEYKGSCQYANDRDNSQTVVSIEKVPCLKAKSENRDVVASQFPLFMAI